MFGHGSARKSRRKVVLQFFDLLDKMKYKEAYALVSVYNDGHQGPDKDLSARATIEYERNQKILITKLIEEKRRTGQKIKVLHIEPDTHSRSIYYVHIQAVGVMDRGKNIFNGSASTTKQTEINNYMITARKDKNQKWGVMLSYQQEAFKGIKKPPRGEKFTNTYFP